MNLLDLPGELILSIAYYLNAKQLSRFSRTSRHVHPLVMPLLYRRNIKYSNASGVNKQLTPLEVGSRWGSFFRNMEADLEEYAHPSTLTDPSGLPLPISVKIRARDKVLSEFIKHGADINTLTEETRYGQKEPLLFHAAHQRELASVILLIKHGANPRVVSDYDKMTALHWAALGGCAKITRFLLCHGADVDISARDDEGRTPLHYAASYGHVAAIRILVEHGADINAQDEEGNTPLHLMMMNGKPAPDDWCIPALRVMFELGADTEVGLYEDGKKALHIAVLNQRDTDFMEVLLSEGEMDLNCRTVGGRTPLSCAIENGDKRIFKMLREAGADVGTRDEQGRSLLQIGLVDYDRAWDCLPTLLEKGLYNLDSDAGEGMTLLELLKQRDWVCTIKGRVEGLVLE
ncbi:ankyrin repeat-containing domain protein [Aspergillus granulosus]|uniref:Ankyrin repeat-containing domain protein n=1 Tax=Aspergillus granulosus TaxID=176169 RepID=A0ABR4H408_9EURO